MTMSPSVPAHRPSDDRPRVAVVYHFFAHYREAVIGRLARSTKARFTFFGDDHDYESSIKAGSFGAEIDHRACPTRRLRGSWMWQPGLVHPMRCQYLQATCLRERLDREKRNQRRQRNPLWDP